MDYASLDNRIAIKAMKEEIGYFPFESAGDYNQQLPTRSQDELRFQLGLRLARKGDVAGARQQMEAILANSARSTSPFTEPARLFLDKYHAKTDLLQVCLASQRCSPYMEPDKLASFIPVNRFDEIINLLKQMRVTMAASGSYDFDTDGQPEYWLLSDFPFLPNFWTFSLSADGIETGNFDLQSENKIEDVQIVSLLPKNDIHLIKVTRGADQSEPLLFYFWKNEKATPFVDEEEADRQLDQIEDGLLSESIPSSAAITQLVDLQNKLLLCDYPTERQAWCQTNSQLKYLLGLSYELENEADLAAKTYLNLWETHPNSPYAIKAESKLETVP
jgi:hypothetical protein